MAKSNTDQSITMEMSKTKETKGTVVFTESTNDPDQRPHTFYVLKDTFAELGSPSEIAVSIEPL